MGRTVMSTPMARRIAFAMAAGGGMAAKVLTEAGADVLMLEAGQKLDIESELRSMEWPYDHPRRGEMPYAAHALVKALREEVDLPIHFHTHDTSGVQAASILRAADAGVDIADAAISSK